MIQSRIIKKQKKAKSIRNPLFIRNQTKLNSDISQVYNSTMFKGTKGIWKAHLYADIRLDIYEKIAKQNSWNSYREIWLAQRIASTEYDLLVILTYYFTLLQVATDHKPQNPSIFEWQGSQQKWRKIYPKFTMTKMRKKSTFFVLGKPFYSSSFTTCYLKWLKLHLN